MLQEWCEITKKNLTWCGSDSSFTLLPLQMSVREGGAVKLHLYLYEEAYLLQINNQKLVA